MSKFLSEPKKKTRVSISQLGENSHLTRHVLHKFVAYKRLRQLLKEIQQIGQFY